jgi:hypothetical protein
MCRCEDYINFHRMVASDELLVMDLCVPYCMVNFLTGVSVYQQCLLSVLFLC